MAAANAKQEVVLKLLCRPQGATLEQLEKATGWLPHTIRGYLSGHLGKKKGYKVVRDGGRGGAYRVEAGPQ